jgi:hypothetical protein
LFGKFFEVDLDLTQVGKDRSFRKLIHCRHKGHPLIEKILTELQERREETDNLAMCRRVEIVGRMEKERLEGNFELQEL